MTVTISPATEEEVQSGEIGRRLREFNYASVGEYPATEYIRLNAREADGAVVGGIRAVVAGEMVTVVEAGGPMSYGPHIPDLHRSAAT